MPRRLSTAANAFLALCLVLAGTAFTARTLVALGSNGLLDWDETYYASTTSTAAHGLGLYPYVLGYPRIHDMGGVGYVVVLYVAAYKLIGAHLLALRLLSLVAGLAAAAGVWTLTRRLHGSAAGLAALALTPSLAVFQLSNTIRFDVFSIAYVAWALLLYLHASGRPQSFRWHALVGLAFALGLEVHLHTAAAAFAVGCAYLSQTIGSVRRNGIDRGWPARRLAAFVAGYAVGAALFLMLNVLPDPHAYVRTAGLARLSAVESGSALNLTARMDTGRLAQSFISPVVIARKEVARYGGLFGAMRWWERLLWMVAIPTYLFVRRGPQRYPGRLLLAMAIVGGGIVFNSSSPLYTSAILPFFVPALATLVTHGFTTRAEVERAEISAASLVLTAVLAAAILPSPLSRTADAIRRLRSDSAPAPPAVVIAVRNAVAPECILAGPTDLYAMYFMAYPKFVGTREVEVLIGSTYYDLQQDPVAYWHEKRPDVLIGPVAGGLAVYLDQAAFTPIADTVWKRPDTLSPGCTIGNRTSISNPGDRP